MSDNPYASNTPQELYTMLRKDGTLTLEQIDQIKSAAFPADVEIDYEDDNVGKMLSAIKAAQEAATKRGEEAKQKAVIDGRADAAVYLLSLNVDPSAVEDAVLDEIALALRTARDHPLTESEETVQILSQDDDTMALVTESGSIVAFIDAPRADADRRMILEWAGERLTRHQAREAALRAEKDFWIKKINAQFDPAINKQVRAQAQVRFSYEPMGKAYLDEIREKAVASGAKDMPKSVKVGMLTLAYKADMAHMEVPDEPKAIAWLEAKELSDAIKVTKSVLKGSIPLTLKAELTEDNIPTTGLYFYPGGVPQFSMK
jgi:hypothetical protein